MLGQIRLQWWRDAIDGIYAGTPRDHAVVTALADAIRRCNLPRARFDRVIDMRAFDLEDRQPDTLDELLSYAEATSGDISCLTLEILGPANSEILNQGRHAGIAWALNGLLRAVPFHAAQRRCYLPKVLTDAHGLSINGIYGGSRGQDLSDPVSEFAAVAWQHLALALDGHPGRDRQFRPAFSCLAVVAADLRRLRKAGYDVFAVKPLGPFRRRWLLSTANFRRNLRA